MITNYKDRIKSKMPIWLLRLFQRGKGKLNLYRIKLYDLKNFEKAVVQNDFKKNEYNLFMYAHIIEKGLSHEIIRFGFGESALTTLAGYLKEFIDNNWSKESLAYRNSLGVLREYIDLHRNNDMKVPDILEKLFPEEVMEDVRSFEERLSGAMDLALESKKNINNFSQLAENRYSIREFDDSEVEISKVFEAIGIAQKSPSACNRQSVKVHIIKNRSLIKELLKIQNGLNGYDLPKMLLVTTVDQVAYSAVYDRNMGYIDGGLFTMSLLYALEERLIGACLLNTNFSKKNDIRVKEMLNMSRSDIFINFIPIGNMKNTMKVCRSKRISTAGVIIEHD